MGTVESDTYEYSYYVIQRVLYSTRKYVLVAASILEQMSPSMYVILVIFFPLFSY